MGAIVFSDGGGSSATNFPGLMDFDYDSFDVISKTADGPTEVRYYSGNLAVLIATVTITYDVDGDIKTTYRLMA